MADRRMSTEAVRYLEKLVRQQLDAAHRDRAVAEARARAVLRRLQRVRRELMRREIEERK